MKSKRKPLTKTQKFARGKPCSLRVPGICRTTPENEDVVLCHAPYPGRGGMRKDDHWGAPGCFRCHNYVDSRMNQRNEMISLEEIWMPAIHEWQEMLIKSGYIKAGKE